MISDMQLLSRFVDDRSGVTAIEYALIASIISIAIFVALQMVGTPLSSRFSSVSDGLR